MYTCIYIYIHTHTHDYVYSIYLNGIEHHITIRHFLSKGHVTYLIIIISLQVNLSPGRDQHPQNMACWKIPELNGSL